MRTFTALIVLGALALAGCSERSSPPPVEKAPPAHRAAASVLAGYHCVPSDQPETFRCTPGASNAQSGEEEALTNASCNSCGLN